MIITGFLNALITVAPQYCFMYGCINASERQSSREEVSVGSPIKKVSRENYEILEMSGVLILQRNDR